MIDITQEDIYINQSNKCKKPTITVFCKDNETFYELQDEIPRGLEMRQKAKERLEELRKPYRGGQVMSAIWRRRGMIYLLEDLLGIDHEVPEE